MNSHPNAYEIPSLAIPLAIKRIAAKRATALAGKPGPVIDVQPRPASK